MEHDISAAHRWDQRYAIDDYLFGTEPATFLTTYADRIPVGSRTLMVADGEGRNSVYLAERGLNVTAMDVSPVAVEKAKALSAGQGVSIDYQVADLLDWAWEPESYDAVVAVFIQFLSPEQRPAVFEGMQRALRPGGRLLLHGYRPEQLSYATGGPPAAENMYTEDLLAASFRDLDIEVLESYDTTITEGSGHDGMSALIDLVATKP